jgi:hypothetical protein
MPDDVLGECIFPSSQPRRSGLTCPANNNNQIYDCLGGDSQCCQPVKMAWRPLRSRSADEVRIDKTEHLFYHGCAARMLFWGIPCRTDGSTLKISVSAE